MHMHQALVKDLEDKLVNRINLIYHYSLKTKRSLDFISDLFTYVSAPIFCQATYVLDDQARASHHAAYLEGKCLGNFS